jgi:NTP pyrophosphatase (non-canonical NTP hydrolase)
MNFNDYQHRTSSTAIYPEGKALEYLALGLCSEAGEVAGKLKKVIRDYDSHLTEEKRFELASELGDVLWYVSQLALELNVTLDNVAHENLAKLADRKERGAISGSGDFR